MYLFVRVFCFSLCYVNYLHDKAMNLESDFHMQFDHNVPKPVNSFSLFPP